MDKKLNKHAIIIKELLSKGWSQKKVAAFLKLSKQKVNYWASHEIKTSQNRKMKQKEIYIQRIIKLAKNKPTSAMSCRKISRMINNVLQRKGETDSKDKIISITYKTMSNILKKHYGRPKKIRKVF